MGEETGDDGLIYRNHEWVLKLIDRNKFEELKKRLEIELRDELTSIEIERALENLIDDPTGGTSNLNPENLALIRKRLFGDKDV